MKEPQLRDVLRIYLNRRLKEFGGSKRAFAEKTGIAGPEVVDASNGKTGVSWGMLAKISDTIGPDMRNIFTDLASIAIEFEAGRYDQIARSWALQRAKQEKAKPKRGQQNTPPAIRSKPDKQRAS